ncbi:MAG: hypothetical protein IJ856_01800, partial [Candidatus Methanomethylophilaceae archaeon]|nr:hypothetical protein [Candidatus Methanomethylophilaceae archaeon]
SFPSMWVEGCGRSMVVSGYTDYRGIMLLLKEISGGRLNLQEPAPSFDNVERFIDEYEKVTTAEIKLLFGLTRKEMNNILESIIRSRRYVSNERESGAFIRRIEW